MLSHYLNINLILRSPILGRRIFQEQTLPGIVPYGVLSPVSRGYPPPEGRLATRYSAVRFGLTQKLAWLNRTRIAVISDRINRN